MKDLAERLWSRVTIADSGCWLWTGCLERQGYGQISLAGKMLKTHRVAYEMVRGAIPAGTEIDHLCRVRACVNPDHLEAVSHRVNVLRGIGPCAQHARKTHCKAGHEFTPENTFVTPRGGRGCRLCRKGYAREWVRRRHPEWRRRVA